MVYAEEYKEKIEYTFNAYCQIVIRHAAIDAGRIRSIRQKREISLEYLTEERFYPLGTSDRYFVSPNTEEHLFTILGQTVELDNGLLAEALLHLTERQQELIFLYYFQHNTQEKIGEKYGRSRSGTGYQIRKAVRELRAEMERMMPHEE